jgi:hypothetical protein
MTFGRLVLAAAVNDPLPAATNARLPPRESAAALLRYYFAHLYSLYPFFPESTLWGVFENAFQPTPPPIRPSDSWLLYMVLAIASSAQSRSSQDEAYQNGVQYVAKALELADKVLAPANAAQIQSLLLLTQYSMLDPAHFDSWHVIGFTARAVIDLGYHQDPPTSQQVDKTLLDMRRKTFYCVYALDRQVPCHSRTLPWTPG